MSLIYPLLLFLTLGISLSRTPLIAIPTLTLLLLDFGGRGGGMLCVLRMFSVRSRPCARARARRIYYTYIYSCVDGSLGRERYFLTSELLYREFFLV